MGGELTALESGLALLYGTFLKYAASEEGDDPTTISKKELSTMIAEQLPHIAGVSHTSAYIYLFFWRKKNTFICLLFTESLCTNTHLCIVI